MKYTYHEWLEGELILNYDCYIPSGKKPTLVKWEDFTVEDVLLIKEKQKEIFDERVISLLEKYKSAFQKDISASLDYEGLCNHTVIGIDSILTDEMPIGWKSEEVIRTELWDVGFTGEYLYGIKKAYKYGFMKGELDCTFINSPNRDYQNPDENLQIYVRSLSAFKNWIESLSFQQSETKTEHQIAKTFEELFYNPENAEPCLRILSELQPPVIDAMNNYIGKAKGVFPLWVKILKNHKPEPLIKHFNDVVYKDVLNLKVKGLNLSKDASEFRKQYKRIENAQIGLDIKAILSQFSQSGKLGK